MSRLAALVVVLMLATAAPARADGELLVSADGTTWSAALMQPLFDPAVRWVPGDQREAGFWIRNTTGQPAQVALSFTAEDVDTLVASGTLTLEARITGGAWQPMLAQGVQHVVAAAIPGDSTTELRVRGSFAPDAGNATMTDVAHLDFTARLTEVDAEPVVPPPGTPATPPTSPTPSTPPTPPAPVTPGSAVDAGNNGVWLPGTGMAIPNWLVVVGLAALIAGIALVSGTRVRRG